jgi:tRNA-splicing ligase RtcB
VVQRQDLRPVGTHLWEIAASFRPHMTVPARLVADEAIVEQALADRSLGQLVNMAALPGIVAPALALPDIHQGYGFPIGGVAATRCADGVISPGGVGYDICCGVRLLASSLYHDEVAPRLESLAAALDHQVPSGVGRKGGVRLSIRELDRVLEQGSQWAVQQGFGRPPDVALTEERGCLPEADAGSASARAKERGKDQIGTLGSGNHFVEVDEVVEVYDVATAAAFGLFPEQIVVQIHSGSRGFGHQVCTDYVQLLQQAVHRYGIDLPDRQLVCAPLASREGRHYLTAMACAANFAWANRQVLAELVRRAFEAALAGHVADWDLHQVYDVAHNMAWIETHDVPEGAQKHPQRLCVHRKGATRAWGPGHPRLPEAYREVGQPVLVPGSMGTSSYVLAGTREATALTFGSCCHGAGRTKSRQAAKKQASGYGLRDELEARGIMIRAGSLAGLAEESPAAYKDVDAVVDVVHEAGIARKVARLRPLVVVKG